MASGNLTLILGAPRSGTTWLAKIFDSHPGVLYRHEPDLVVRSDFIPVICPEGNLDHYVEAMRRFIPQMIEDRSLKYCGSLPVFRKNDDGFVSFLVRRWGIYGLRLLQKILPDEAGRGLRVPHFAADVPAGAHCVIKSISSLGRGGLFLQALPEARIILIVRHPFGQIASRLHGLAHEKFERNEIESLLLGTEQAKRYGLTEERLKRMPLAQQFAWEWALQNEKALDDLEGHPRARVIRYSDLADDPMAQARGLFAFAGLPWHAETGRFIVRSTTYKGPDLYYQVFRNIAATRDKWRATLTMDEKQQILEVMRGTRVGRLWPELIENPESVFGEAMPGQAACMPTAA